jgi:hypothetical protein
LRIRGWNAVRHHPMKKPEVLRSPEVLTVPRASRRWFTRRVGAVEFLAWKLLRQRSNGESGVSSTPRCQSAVRWPLERVRSAVSSRRSLVRSDSQSSLRFRKRRCALFQTNLPSSSWFVSCGLMNLLVARIAISVQPSFPMLSEQGPQRAGTAVPEPNCFPLHPKAFHQTRPQGDGGNTVRDLTGDSALFVSDLRAEGLLLFFAAIAVLPGFCATQGSSAIRRPNVSSQAKSAIRRCDCT